MKNIFVLIYVFTFLLNYSTAQSLGRVGSITDVTTVCSAGTVLMGGGTDVDAAFTWMISKSGGGDFVVIRATGTNAYNSYIYGLGNVNSVETFLINSVALANDSVIVQAVRKAEAVFFAGGNQNDYISYYKGTALGSTLDYLANIKHAPIGGTSAGMAIQGYIYYDGVTNVLSPDVLSDPYLSGTGLHYNDFFHNPFLQNTICDTHFITKGGTTANGITGRQGRLMTFLARIIIDSSLTDVKGIACEEKTAVCIDENGIGMVVGLGNAYFLRQWCAAPETCVSGQPLTWTNGVKVYVIPGPGNYSAPPSVSKSIDLNNWTTVAGGNYEYWNVNGGTLTIGQSSGTPIVCNTLGETKLTYADGLLLFPNPVNDFLTIKSFKAFMNARLGIRNSLGKLILLKTIYWDSYEVDLDVSGLSRGIYILEIQQDQELVRTRIIIQ